MARPFYHFEPMFDREMLAKQDLCSHREFEIP